MMMDSDSSYKPNGDYLSMSPFGWHTSQELQFANAPTYSYGDYGTVVVKSEYEDCSGGGCGGGDGDGGDGGGGGGIDEGGSSSSPGLEQESAGPKKGNHHTLLFTSRLTVYIHEFHLRLNCYLITFIICK